MTARPTDQWVSKPGATAERDEGMTEKDFDWEAEDSEISQLAEWALKILGEAKGAWVVPETYSMKRTLDLLWVANFCEKGWHNGQNAYRVEATP